MKPYDHDYYTINQHITIDYYIITVFTMIYRCHIYLILRGVSNDPMATLRRRSSASLMQLQVSVAGSFGYQPEFSLINFIV